MCVCLCVSAVEAAVRGPTCVRLVGMGGGVPGSGRGGSGVVTAFYTPPDAEVKQIPNDGSLYVIDPMIERDLGSGGEGATSRIRADLAKCVGAARASQERVAKAFLPSYRPLPRGLEIDMTDSPHLDAAVRSERASAEVHDRGTVCCASSTEGAVGWTSPPLGAERSTRQRGAAALLGVGESVCQTVDALCYGCKLSIGVGVKAGAAGGHLTHFSAACIQRGQARFERENVRTGAERLEESEEEASCHVEAHASASAGTDGMSTPTQAGRRAEAHLGSRNVADKRRASRRAMRLGPARCRSAMACLEGICGGDSEVFDMFCHGCGVGIHGSRCFHLSAGRVSVGLFECAACNLQAARGAGEEDAQLDMGEDANMLAMEAMLGRMTAGSENFGKAIARANKLQSEFVGFMTQESGGTFSLPVDSSASMELFARWMGSRRDLAPSLRQVVSGRWVRWGGSRGETRR